MGKIGGRGGRGSCMIWTDRWAGDYRLRGGRNCSVFSTAMGPFLSSSTFSQAGWSQDGPHGVNHPRQAVDLTDKHVGARESPALICLFVCLSVSSPQPRVLTSARSSLFICLSTWSPVLFCVSMRPSTTIVHQISNAIRKTRSASRLGRQIYQETRRGSSRNNR